MLHSFSHRRRDTCLLHGSWLRPLFQSYSGEITSTRLNLRSVHFIGQLLGEIKALMLKNLASSGLQILTELHNDSRRHSRDGCTSERVRRGDVDARAPSAARHPETRALMRMRAVFSRLVECRTPPQKTRARVRAEFSRADACRRARGRAAPARSQACARAASTGPPQGWRAHPGCRFRMNPPRIAKSGSKKGREKRNSTPAFSAKTGGISKLLVVRGIFCSTRGPGTNAGD